MALPQRARRCFSLRRFARRFKELHQPGWAAYSLITGIFFLVAFFGIASGAKGAVIACFGLAVAFGFAWLSLVLRRIKSTLRGSQT